MSTTTPQEILDLLDELAGLHCDEGIDGYVAHVKARGMYDAGAQSPALGDEAIALVGGYVIEPTSKSRWGIVDSAEVAERLAPPR